MIPIIASSPTHLFALELKTSRILWKTPFPIGLRPEQKIVLSETRTYETAVVYYTSGFGKAGATGSVLILDTKSGKILYSRKWVGNITQVSFSPNHKIIGYFVSSQQPHRRTLVEVRLGSSISAKNFEIPLRQSFLPKKIMAIDRLPYNPKNWLAFEKPGSWIISDGVTNGLLRLTKNKLTPLPIQRVDRFSTDSRSACYFRNNRYEIGLGIFPVVKPIAIFERNRVPVFHAYDATSRTLVVASNPDEGSELIAQPTYFWTRFQNRAKTELKPTYKLDVPEAMFVNPGIVARVLLATSQSQVTVAVSYSQKNMLWTRFTVSLPPKAWRAGGAW